MWFGGYTHVLFSDKVGSSGHLKHFPLYICWSLFSSSTHTTMSIHSGSIWGCMCVSLLPFSFAELTSSYSSDALALLHPSLEVFPVSIPTQYFLGLIIYLARVLLLPSSLGVENSCSPIPRFPSPSSSAGLGLSQIVNFAFLPSSFWIILPHDISLFSTNSWVA